MCQKEVTIVANPRFLSPIPANVDLAEAERGARMLGLELTPQGRNVAGVLAAQNDAGGALYRESVIQLPRRATKTTAIWATILGRAATREGYRCVTTAQSGSVASRILLEHAERMLAAGTAIESRDRGKVDGAVVLFRNGGREHLDFPNGARIWCVPPNAGAVRSQASDDIVIDEGGEFEGQKGSDFLTGARPLMDTRGPLAQLIVAGTPGRARSGLLWDMLTDGRKLGKVGIVDYSARDDDDPADRSVWARVHPGPDSGLTPLSVIEERFEQMDLADFAREYLCLWPSDAATGALDVAAWTDQGHDGPPERPERWVLAFDSPKDATVSSVVAAWRDADGRAWFEVLAHRPGTSWVARFVHKVARDTRAEVVFDEIGANTTTAAELRRLTPRAKTTPLLLRSIAGAAQLLATEVKDGRVGHYRQPDLDRAVESTTWRPAGRDSRAFGWRPGGAHVSPVVAASLALWHFDDTRPKPRLKGRVI
jgi:hypothetical protein